MKRLPLTNEIIISLAKLVDDSQEEKKRKPAHSDITFYANKFNLQGGDPASAGRPLGKSKRVRHILDWGLENAPEETEQFAAAIIDLVRGSGGFRVESENYVGKEYISNLQDALKRAGIQLFEDGTWVPTTLDNLSHQDRRDVLLTYISRAKRGVNDAALIVGTSKDLLEAVSAFVVETVRGSYDTKWNFPTLLGNAFSALELTAWIPNGSKSDAHQRFEESLFNASLAVNTLRNKEGTGHGRPWLPNLNASEAKAALEIIGVISEYMLNKLSELGYK